MAARLRNWIEPAIVAHVNSVLKQLEDGGDTKADPPILKKHMKKAKEVQLLEGSSPGFLISDGTTFVEAEFDRTEVDRFERDEGRNFSDIRNAFLAISNYDLLTPYLILDLDSSAEPSVHFFVGGIKVTGEGSAPIGRPSDVNEKSKLQNIYEELKNALQNRNDQPSSMPHPPVQSQEVPPASQIHISVGPSNAASQTATQAYNNGKRPAARSFTNASFLLAALNPSSESPQNQVPAASKVVLKQVSAELTKEKIKVLESRANQQQRYSTPPSKASSSLEPAGENTRSNSNSREAPVLLVDEDEKENSQENMQKVQRDTPKQAPIEPKVEPVKATIKDWVPDMSRKTLNRKLMNVPSRFQQLEKDAWDRDREHANVLQEDVEHHLAFLSRRSSRVKDSVSHELSDDGTSDESEDKEEIDDEVDSQDAEEEEEQENDPALMPHSNNSQASDAGLSQSWVSDQEDQSSDDEPEEYHHMPTTPRKAFLSPSPSSLADQESVRSAFEQHISPSPILSQRSRESEPLSGNESAENSSSAQKSRTTKSFMDIPTPQFRQPANFSITHSSQEDELEDELEISVLHAVGDVVEEDDEPNEMLETSQELPCTAPRDRKQILVEQTPVRPGVQRPDRSTERNKIDSSHLPSDSVVPATFDSTNVPSSIPSSVLRELVALDPSSSRRSMQEESHSSTIAADSGPVNVNHSDSEHIAPEASVSVSILDKTPPISPMIQIPVTGRKSKPSTPHTSSSGQPHILKRTSEEDKSGTKRLKYAGDVGDVAADDDGPRARHIARENKHRFLAKIRASNSRASKSPVAGLTDEVTSFVPVGDGRGRISSTYEDEHLEKSGNEQESVSGSSLLTPDSKRYASAQKSKTSHRHYRDATPQNTVSEPAIESEVPKLDDGSPAISQPQASVASPTRMDNVEEGDDESPSKTAPDLQPDTTDMADQFARSPGSPFGNSTQLVSYEEFKATYPDYDGNKAEFTRAVVYLEWLNKECNTTPEYCDDFIRVLAGDYKKLVAEYKRQMKKNDGGITGSVSPKKCPTGYEFYEQRSSEPVYVYDIIHPQNIQAALCTLDSWLVRETRGRYWPDDESIKGVRSNTTDAPARTRSVDSPEGVALDTPRGTSPLDRTIAPEAKLPAAGFQRARDSGVMPKRRFFETASQQVNLTNDNLPTLDASPSCTQNTGDENIKSVEQRVESKWNAFLQSPTRVSSVSNNGLDRESRSRKSLPWLSTPQRSSTGDHLRSASSARTIDKEAKTPTSVKQHLGSPILGSLRNPSPEARESKRKRGDSSSTAELADAFKSSPPIPAAARRVIMPAKSMEDLGRPPRDHKRQRTARSSPEQNIGDMVTPVSKSTKNIRRTTMPAGGIDTVGKVKDGMRTPAKTSEWAHLKKSGWIPPSLRKNAKKAMPSEPQTQGWSF